MKHKLRTINALVVMMIWMRFTTISSSTQCTHQFPKVIGGTKGPTKLYGIDYFSATDSIAVVGYSEDAITNIPSPYSYQNAIILLYTSQIMKWQQYLVGTSQDYYFYYVQFSADGQCIVTQEALTYQYYILSTLTGGILKSFQINTSTVGMALVTSGTIYVLYVQEKSKKLYKIYDILQSPSSIQHAMLLPGGQTYFGGLEYDPVTPSILQAQGGILLQHSAIDLSLLQAYSQSDNVVTFSYQNFNPHSLLVFATNPLSLGFVQTSSSTFTYLYSLSLTTYNAYTIQIIDINSALLIVSDTMDTYIGSISIGSTAIQLIKIFDDVTTISAVLLSPTEFIISGCSNYVCYNFETGTNQYYLQDQGVIYSSNQANTCQRLAQTTSAIAIISTSTTIITSVTPTLSPVTKLITYYTSNTFAPLVTSAMTIQNDDWCDQAASQLTSQVISTQTQTTNSFLSQSNSPIIIQFTSFSQVQVCSTTLTGSQAFTYTFSGLTGQTIASSTTNQLIIPAHSSSGTFQIKITGTASVGGAVSTAIITLIGQNPPPFFDSALVDQTVYISQTLTYLIPSSTDPRNSKKSIIIQIPQQAALFISGDSSNNQIIISPQLLEQEGVYKVGVTVCNSVPLCSLPQTFTVNVIRPLPYFQKQMPQDQSVHLNAIVDYQLPYFTDQSLSIQTFASMSNVPNCVTFNSDSNIFRIAPTKTSDIGIWRVTGSINDAVVSVSFSFSVIIINSAPYFTSLLQDQECQLDNQIAYSLPSMKDNENYIISVNFDFTLPTFIVYSAGTFTFSPESGMTKVQTYTISLSLSDGLLENHYFYNLKITEIPSQVESLISGSNSNNSNNIKNAQPRTIISSLKISQINNNGFARIIIIADDGGDMIVNLITNQSLALSINGIKLVTYQIVSKSIQQQSLDLQISFNDSSQISIGQVIYYFGNYYFDRNLTPS